MTAPHGQDGSSRVRAAALVAVGAALIIANVTFEAFDIGGSQFGWKQQLLLVAGASALLSGAAWLLGLRNRCDIGALVVGTGLGLLYLSPALGPLLTHGMSWPVRTSLPEGLSLTTNARWLVEPPHDYLSDAFSGDFLTFYNYLSDAVTAAIAHVGGWPPMVVQVAIMAPLLAFLMVIGAYLSVMQVVKSRRIALTAAMIVALLGNSQLPRLVSNAHSHGLDEVLHVPFHALGLATNQSLGWVLFLPCICLLYSAHREFKPHRAVVLGALLGALLHAHLLTFINVAAIHVVYLALATGIEHPRGRPWRLWLGGVIVVVVASLTVVVASEEAPFGLLVASGCLVLAFTFLLDSRKRFYLWTYGTAAAIAAPFLLPLLPHLGDLTVGSPTHVSLRDGALFFSVYLIATGAVLVSYRDRPVVVWLVACIGVTLFLGLNHKWGWENHPYRFVIHLLFPFAVGTSIAVHTLPRRLAVPLAVWLIALAILNVTDFARGDRVYLGIDPGTPDEARFLERVRDATAALEGSGARILNPAGEDIQALMASALMLNYSHIPGFIPDYRYLVHRERYLNRLSTVCLLFPTYPCSPGFRPEPDLFRVLDDRLMSTITAVHAIRLAGSAGMPFSEVLRSRADAYGWKLIAQERPDAVLYRVQVEPMEGVARVGSVRSDGGQTAIRFNVDNAGDQFILIGGWRLGAVSERPIIDGMSIEPRSSSADWAVYKVRLTAGDHQISLAQPRAADHLFFFNIIESGELSRYVRMTRRP